MWLGFYIEYWVVLNYIKVYDIYIGVGFCGFEIGVGRS